MVNEQLHKYIQGELGLFEERELLQEMEVNELLRKEYIRMKNLSALIDLAVHAGDKKKGQYHYSKQAYIFIFVN